MKEPRKLWLLTDTGPVDEPTHPPNPLGICESLDEARAVVAWRFAVQRRTTDFRALPFIPAAVEGAP
jgi:hypothetical protein